MITTDQFAKHGDARFASSEELKDAKFYDHGGVYVGLDNDGKTPLYFNGEGHLLTVAPAGFGKTTKLIVPNLLSYDRGSVVVTDPKGVVTAVTRRHREEAFGNRIIVLNPWREEIAREGDDSIGLDLGETGYNPLRVLVKGDPSIIDEAEAAFSIICPVPVGVKGSEKFFAETAQTILIACSIFLAETEGGVSLPRLYEFIRTDNAGWKKITEAMLDYDGFDFAPYVGEILSNMDGQNQWAGVKSSMEQATRIYNPSKPLGRHVSKDEFNPDDLKREKITVYVVIPSNRRKQNERWLGLVLASIAESVGKPSKSSPVLLIAEEFANLGYLPSIPSAMAEYREAGLKVHLIIQNLKQLDIIYGRDGAEDLINNCNLQQFFAVNDPDLAQRLERIIGTYTATIESVNVNWWWGESRRVEGQASQPLARSQDILNMRDDEQLILTTGQTPVIFGRLKGYYADRKLNALADPNPMRGKEPDEKPPALLDALKAKTDDAPSLLASLSGRFGRFLLSRIPERHRATVATIWGGLSKVMGWLSVPFFWIVENVSPALRSRLGIFTFGLWFFAAYKWVENAAIRDMMYMGGFVVLVLWAAPWVDWRKKRGTFQKHMTVEKRNNL